MKEKFTNLLENLIFVLIILSVIASILFFLPTTSEFFEYNKFTVTLVITILILIFWGIKMIIAKRAVFTRTPLDVPLIILLVVFLIAAFASIDQFISLFGKHGR